MNCIELRDLKAGLLCYGINVDKKVGEDLVKERPYFYDKGFVHAVNTNIMGSNICVSVAENFSEKSPYHLIRQDGNFYVTWDNKKVIISLFDDLPRTGTIIDDIARPHSNQVISIWPSLVCCFAGAETKCKFCSIKPTEKQTVVPAGEIVDGFRKLFAITDKYSINLGGGTYISPDNMADYLCDIISGIRTFTDNPISVELAPPSLEKIKKLKNSGASSLIMNLEVADDNLRKQICPGKSTIPYDYYYRAYRYGVEVFGRGKISSVLICGIQPDEDIVSESIKLTDTGVIPTIIPFKAMDECELNNKKNCRKESLIKVSEQVGAILRSKGLNPESQEGCTKCGGCSLETNYYND